MRAQTDRQTGWGRDPDCENTPLRCDEGQIQFKERIDLIDQKLECGFSPVIIVKVRKTPDSAKHREVRSDVQRHA